MQQNDFDYKKAWKNVDNLIAQQKPQSALAEINNIYQIARQAENEVQVTKAIFYKGKITLITNENGVEKVIDLYEKELTSSKIPFKNILESQLADFYLQYFNSNRYQISQRIEISSAIDDNVKTMSTQSFIEKINDLYLNSVDNLDDLDFDISEIAPLIVAEYNNEGLERRPKLYNLLADRVLKYLKQGDKRPTLPSDQFIIDSDKYLGELKEFTSIDIKTPDDKSTVYRSLKLLQKLLSESNSILNNKYSAATAEIDFYRLKYVHQNYPGHTEKYLSSLISLAEKSKKNSVFSEVAGAIAQIYSQKEEFEQKELGAQWCEKGIAAFPNSPGAQNCRGIKAGLEQTNLALIFKEGYPIGSDIPVTIKYKNIKEANFAIYRVKEGQRIDVIISNRKQKLPTFIHKDQKVAAYTIGLKDTSYLEFHHKAMIDGLQAGTYILEAKEERGGKKTYGIFTVSNLSLINIQDQNAQKILVVNRSTGQPITGVNVQFYEHVYNRNTRTQDLNKVALEITDGNGSVVPPHNKQGLLISVQKGIDFFFNSQRLYAQRKGNNKGYKSVEVFTDRAIYRPGQVVYYTGLSLHYNRERIPSILSNENITITLRDANYQEVISSEFKTNEYGSFTGTFVLPIGGLTGNYTLQTTYGGKSIKVEEYKRPTFEITHDIIKDPVSLGGKVNQTGIAKGLAGNAITEAKVNYIVYRQLVYPRYCYYFPYSQNKEMVTTGSTTTDANGAFTITFDTKKENTEGIRGIYYNYTLETTVVDPSGESQIAKKYISLLDTDFSLSIEVENQIDKKDTNTFKVTAKNSDGLAIKTNGTYSVFSLKKDPDYSPNNNRYFRYNNGTDKEWIKDKLIATQSFITDLPINIENLEVGFYLIEAEADDSNGSKVEAKSRLKVLDTSKGKYPKVDLLYAINEYSAYQPGEELSMIIGTSEPITYLHYTLTRGEEKTIVSEWKTLNAQDKINYKITEKDRGGLQLFIGGVKDNKAFTKSINIVVPWSNKELTITYETFRDKIEPGDDESYNINIKRNDGKPVEAELLLGLYDASLDQFSKNQWRTRLYPTRYRSMIYNAVGFNNGYSYKEYKGKSNQVDKIDPIIYPTLLGYNQYEYYTTYSYDTYEEKVGIRKKSLKSRAVDGIQAAPAGMAQTADMDVESENLSTETTEAYIEPVSEEKSTNPIRDNLNETVFFMPQVNANKDGTLTVSYTMNDALTRWKLMTMAHTKDLSIGYDERNITTSKDVMIIPNSPRFLRLGDELWFTARVANLSTQQRNYNAQLSLFNDLSEEDISEFIVKTDNAEGSIAPNQTLSVGWLIKIPSNTNLDLLRYIASVKSGNKSDAEQNFLPVLSNKIPVIETQSIFVNGNNTKEFDIKMLEGWDNKTRINKSYTVEYTSNPVWYAIQALPYLSNKVQISTVSMLNAYFGNCLGKNIIATNPKIEQIFKILRQEGGDALKSNLEKNQDLKQLVLTETPWVSEALKESDQKANISQFFDQNSLNNALRTLQKTLQDRQSSNGGYSWVPGGRDNLMVTLYVLETSGKLKSLGIEHGFTDASSKKASRYVDQRLLERYYKLLEYNSNLEEYTPSFYDVFHLNVRSLHGEHDIDKSSKIAYEFYTKQAIKMWNSMDIYTQAILGQYLFRNDVKTYQDIKASMIERSFTSEELGRYWNAGNGFEWHQLPIERHSTILDFFVEIGSEDHLIDELKIWLLKNKQVNNWKTSKATAAAVYSLIQKGSKKEINLRDNSRVEVLINKIIIAGDDKDQAGTGYIKKNYPTSEINNDLSKVVVTNQSDHITWGGIYYQYLEEVSNIKGNSSGPLSIVKELYKSITNDQGESLIKIGEDSPLAPGDIIVSRIVIKSDRDMQYIDIKDMRGAGIEPYKALSRYYWRSGLSYYHSIRDISDNYFIEYLPKGTHVFEQKQKVVHRGKYGAGIASIQCAYAPEFSSTSKGFELEIK
jgi:hypothetical protein